MTGTCPDRLSFLLGAYNADMSKRAGQPPLKWVRQERLPTPDELDWLRSEQGRDVCRRMAHDEPADTPARIAHWRESLRPEQVSAAWAQVLLRRRAAGRFTRAPEMLFDRVGLEQATGEIVARHKARRFAGIDTVADLCCGIGGDAIGLAAGRELLVVDYRRERLVMAEHNASVYGHRVETVAADVSLDAPDARAAHLDPDRRSDGKRSHDPTLSSPSLEVVTDIVEKYRNVAIKLAPGADLAELPFEGEIELISVHGECKQAVVWTGKLQQALRRATVLPSGQSLSAGPNDDTDWPEPRDPRAGGFIFEPDPAVIRANLVGPLATQHGLAPVDPRICYLVGDEPVASPMLAAFRIIDVQDFGGKRNRPWLAAHDIGELELKTRGFAARPDDILRQLKLRGSRSATLLLTRIDGKATAILAERLPSPEGA